MTAQLDTMTKTENRNVEKTEKQWFVYMIQTKCDKLYTGITTDIERRFNEHFQCFKGESNKGAKYFRGRRPMLIVYRELCENRSAASIREYQIKKMSALQKRALIKGVHT